jgi:hypothetical protein
LTDNPVDSFQIGQNRRQERVIRAVVLVIVQC